jgi:DNA adenine methylase
MYAVSPLRYPGAKWRLQAFMSDVIRENDLEGGHYAEVYAGGASLALSLLFSEAVGEIHINDFDRSIWAFWKSATEHSDELIARVRETGVNVRQWHTQRLIQADKDRAAVVDLGFSTFFLNRTNRSGILDGGVIGGQRQDGKWKINARYNKTNLIERLMRIRKYRARIHVTRLDAEAFIARHTPVLPKKRSLVYLDPPYFKKGRELYMNSYAHADHASVADAVIQKLDRPWIVSYDDVAEIRKLYRGIRRLQYTLRYSASTTRQGNEVMFIQDGLKTRPKLIDMQ